MTVARIAATTITNLADNPGAPWIAKSAMFATAKASQTHHRMTGGASRNTSRSAAKLAGRWVVGVARGAAERRNKAQAIRTRGSSSA